MGENTQFAIAFICGIILFVYLFIFVFIKGNTKGNKFKENAIKKGNIVKGRAIKNDHRRFTGPDGHYRSEIVTYEYFVKEQRYTKKITFTDTGIVVNYPDTTDFYYDDKNPNKAYAEVELDHDSQKQLGCYITIIIPIIVIILIYNLLKLL